MSAPGSPRASVLEAMGVPTDVRFSEARIAEPAWLIAGLVAAVAVLMARWWSRRRRGRSLRAIAGPGGSASHETGRWRLAAGWVAAMAVALGIALGAAGIARPQSDPREREVIVQGRDLIFVLDVSRSMLATDVAPSRLERAKVWIRDVLASRPHDRVGLVLFAGAAVVASPLTLDHGFVRLALDEASPASVPRGGTLIGDAIRKVLVDVLESQPATNVGRDVILISDGEDHESFPDQAAARAAELGVRIVALSIGTASGAEVPGEGGSALVRDGTRVISRADAGTLQRVARASTGGIFLDVGDGTIQLDRVYGDLVRGEQLADIGRTTDRRWQEWGPLLLLLAVGVLLTESVARGRAWR